MIRWLTSLALIFSLGAFAASEVETLRHAATQARDRIQATQQAKLEAQGELDALSNLIKDLKKKSRGRLSAGSELDRALKKSQALSATLTDSARTLASQEALLESANLSLLNALSKDLGELRSSFDRETDRNKRKALVNKMRQVRAERDQLQSQISVSRLPALNSFKASDNPEDLLEQADLLKDNEDKVMHELQALDKRIAEAKAERDLEQRVRQSLGDEAIFDENDRTLRLSGPSAASKSAAAPQVGSPPEGRTAEADSQGTQQSGSFGGNQQPGSGGSIPNLPSGPRLDGTQPAQPASQNADFNNGFRGATAQGPLGDDLNDLEAYRKRLKSMADTFHSRAQDLQKKAAEIQAKE